PVFTSSASTMARLSTGVTPRGTLSQRRARIGQVPELIEQPASIRSLKAGLQVVTLPQQAPAAQALSLGQSGQLTRRNTAQAAGGLLLSGALSLSRFTLRGLLQGVLSLGFALDSRSPGFLGGLTLCRCPVIISPHGHRLARQS